MRPIRRNAAHNVIVNSYGDYRCHVCHEMEFDENTTWLRLRTKPCLRYHHRMQIWKQPISVQLLTHIHKDTAVSHLGIEFLEVGDDFIKARIPVNAHTRQPFGLLHGGVSVVLAETLGSCGANYCCPEGTRAVGLDINANHLRGVIEGYVTGITRPVHLGRSTQVWQIDLFNDAGEMTCASRITMAVLASRA
jgi:1,4-dihydroxy-2-naphthoyl-CoA hydrolase